MKLTFLGADHEVTGSCHYLSACGKNILVDCGMEQGNDVYENQELPIEAADVDFVLITHAHIDHAGLVPLLYARGFRGKIYATQATMDLCSIMLKDSAHIQEFEAEWRNRKAKRSGREEFIPLYSTQDAIDVMELFVPCSYNHQIEICDDISIRFTDIGHLIGSSSIEVWVREGSLHRKIVFSGDIGNVNKPLVKDPMYTYEADYVVMESTYGDKYHSGSEDSVSQLAEIITTTLGRGGNLIIPSFAVGRTQEILYYLRKIKANDLCPEIDDFEVYLDSPLAVEATSIFNQNMEDCFDREAMSLVRQGINPISFKGLRLSVTGNDSKAINFDPNPKVIISASGMCEAGRVRHHLKHNLWREECTILFVGYQANGTLGRAILEGASSVKLFGEEVEVKAQILKLPGTSGHADKKGLIDWLSAFEHKPHKVFLVHGEDNVVEIFADCLRNEYGYHVEAPYTGGCYDLKDGMCITEGNRTKKTRRSVEGRKINPVYERLILAGKRLMTVISHNEGGANKDLAKFADQINSLCEKWDR